MRSGSATELSAYTYQRAIKLTPLGKAPVLVAPVTVRVPLKRPRAAETDHTNQTRQTVASPLLHRGSRPRFPSSNRPLQPCQDTRCIAWLGRMRWPSSCSSQPREDDERQYSADYDLCDVYPKPSARDSFPPQDSSCVLRPDQSEKD